MADKLSLDIAIERGFRYDSETGLITTSTNRISKPNKDGYMKYSLSINGKQHYFSGHRLAWYVVYNEIPKVIDHIDGDKSNNKISNLRNVTQVENNRNRLKALGATLDYKGKYRAQIKVGDKNIYLGLFNSKEETREAYLKAKIKYHNLNYTL